MSRLHETRVMCVAPGPNEWNEYEAFIVQYHYAAALAEGGGSVSPTSSFFYSPCPSLRGGDYSDDDAAVDAADAADDEFPALPSLLPRGQSAEEEEEADCETVGPLRMSLPAPPCAMGAGGVGSVAAN
eukprot:2767112-Rhodomonas_salina.1